jgi:hypothetical protein
VGVFGFFNVSQLEVDFVTNLVASAGSSMGGMLLSLLFILFSFSLTCSIYFLMAICELFSHFSMSCMGSLHPWMANDISH